MSSEESSGDMVRSVASAGVLWVGLVACRHGPPTDWTPLEQVVDREVQLVERRAADWGMPLALTRAYLQTSAAGCPLAHSALPAVACLQVPPEQGQTPEAPLVWGPALAESPLPWFGRLRCASGATPVVYREEVSAGLQAWTARCPGLVERRWYVSAAASCGNPCPPTGLVLLPGDALILEHLAEEALAEQRLGDALRHAVELTVRAGEFASSWSQLGAAQAANDNYRAARDAFDHAAAIHAEEVDYAWYATLAAWSAHDWADAATRAAAVQVRLGLDDARRPDALCTEATARERLGEPGAAALLEAACAAGAQGCCP